MSTDPEGSVPNTEAYSTNFYLTYVVDGQEFSSQMTVRGGANGTDHIQRVKGAMAYLIKIGCKAGKPERAITADPPAKAGGGPFEWTKDKGKTVLRILGNSPTPSEIACPIHDGKMMKRHVKDDNEWLSHKQGDGYCNANIARAS